MSEVYEATQIILIAGKFGYMVGRMSLVTALQVAKVLNTVYLSKWKGKTSLNRFRHIKGEEFTFINVNSENRKILSIIEKEMEAHGILLARLPDLCGGDQNTQYIISPSDAAKFKAFLIDHNYGQYGKIHVGVISAADYASTSQKVDGETTPDFKDLQRTIPSGMEVKQSGLPEKKEEFTLKDAGTKLQDAIRQGKPISWIEGYPIKQHEKWCMYKTPDGENVILIPKEDMEEIRKNKDGTIYNSRAAIFPEQNYIMLSLKDGTPSVIDGEKAALEMGKENISEKNRRLKAFQQEIKKDLEQDLATVSEKRFIKISSNRKLFYNMDGEDNYIVRIPYQKNMYISFPKKNSFLTPSEDTLVSYVKRDLKYKVTDANGQLLKWINGAELMQYYKTESAHRKNDREENGQLEGQEGLDISKQREITIQKSDLQEKSGIQDDLRIVQGKNSQEITKITVENSLYRNLNSEYIIDIPGELDLYLKVPQRECFAMANKDLLLFFKDKKEYCLTDRWGNNMGTIAGEQLKKYWEKEKTYKTEQELIKMPRSAR